jgi:hypothetical protein
MNRRFASALLAGTVLFGNAPELVAVSPPTVENDLDAGKVDMAPRTVARPAPSPAEHVPAGNPLWGIPLKQLVATRERPIFSPSRRPPPPAVVGAPRVAPVVKRAAPKPVPERPQLLLVGTVVGDQEKIGVFVEQATKNVVRLKVGDEHQGWMLHSVERREATLEKDHETATLTFPQPAAAPAAAAAPSSTANSPARRRGR